MSFASVSFLLFFLVVLLLLLLGSAFCGNKAPHHMPGNPSDSQLCFLWLVEYATLPAFNGNYMDFLFYRGKKR